MCNILGEEWWETKEQVETQIVLRCIFFYHIVYQINCILQVLTFCVIFKYQSLNIKILN